MPHTSYKDKTAYICYFSASLWSLLLYTFHPCTCAMRHAPCEIRIPQAEILKSARIPRWDENGNRWGNGRLASGHRGGTTYPGGITSHHRGSVAVLARLKGKRERERERKRGREFSALDQACCTLCWKTGGPSSHYQGVHRHIRGTGAGAAEEMNHQLFRHGSPLQLAVTLTSWPAAIGRDLRVGPFVSFPDLPSPWVERLDGRDGFAFVCSQHLANALLSEANRRCALSSAVF